MDFTLDTDAARKSDSGSAFISGSGKFVGKLIRAADVVSDRGTQGVDLLFRTASGETADYITLWHTRKDGTKLPGFEAINAMMTCMRLRNAKKAMHKTEKWDKDKRAYVSVELLGYPEFCNKPIGMVIQETIEDGRDNKSRSGKRIIAFFDPETELTAREILDKVSRPQSLARRIDYLVNHPVHDNRKNKTAYTISAGDSEYSQAGTTNIDFDDEIPF